MCCADGESGEGFWLLPTSFPSSISALLALPAELGILLLLRLSSLQTNDRFHREKEKERERTQRENTTASDPAVCKCYSWNHSLFFLRRKKKKQHSHTYMPQGMSPLPFQKSTEWIKKWMELIKKTKKEQMEESGGLIQWADGSWCQFELFWSTELKPELQPSPKHITFDPHDRHNTVFTHFLGIALFWLNPLFSLCCSLL